MDEKARLELFNPDGQVLQDLMQTSAVKPEALRQLAARLPQVEPSLLRLDQDWVTIGNRTDLTDDQRDCLIRVLQDLKPWRKGPFNLLGVEIDSEWQSCLKWHRVAPHLSDLSGRKVLDVGCSNGYYLFRMAAGNPAVLLGIDPYIRNYQQFHVLQHYARIPRLLCLPVGLEALMAIKGWFDTIFCMGILYHRRAPLDTLAQLKAMLAPGGELVLETLILPNEGDLCLFPQDRYAAMPNVYFIPTVACLKNWLTRIGFANIRCVDITKTSGVEQRKTAWIDSASLDAFLDPADPEKTIEGYPAPVRAIVLADAGNSG